MHTDLINLGLKECALTGKVIDNCKVKDSKGHIIPNALGGRLKPKGILSAEGNLFLQKKIEQPFIDNLAPSMTLAGYNRDRGKSPDIRMKTENGFEASYTNNGEITGNYGIRGKGNGAYSIIAKDKKDAKELLKKLQKNNPELTDQMVDERLEKASVQSTENQMFKITGVKNRPSNGHSFKFDYFMDSLNAYNMLSLFMAHKLKKIPILYRCLHRTDCDVIEMWREILQERLHLTAYCFQANWIQGDIESSNHKLILKRVPNTAYLIGYVEIFSIIKICSVMSVTCDEDIEEQYCFDIGNNKEFEVTIDDNILLLQSNIK